MKHIYKFFGLIMIVSVAFGGISFASYKSKGMTKQIKYQAESYYGGVVEINTEIVRVSGNGKMLDNGLDSFSDITLLFGTVSRATFKAITYVGEALKAVTGWLTDVGDFITQTFDGTIGGGTTSNGGGGTGIRMY